MQQASTSHAQRFVFNAVLICGLAGCSTLHLPSAAPVSAAPADLPGDPAAPSQVTPQEALTIAESYVRHPWQPFANNILHGRARDGVRVDTPDLSYAPENGRDGWWMPGQVNSGVPYKWGGFDDLASFDRAILQGLAGGDVSTPAKRRADDAAVSIFAAGVDCSGFVSRCLKLPVLHDSARLPELCDPLASADDLRPGDLLNIPRQHMVLFAGWSGPDRASLLYYETGGIPDWKPGLKQSPRAKMLALGYQPLRYRGMARPAIPDGKQVLTRAARERAVLIEEPQIGEP